MPFVYLPQYVANSNLSMIFGIQGIRKPYSLCFRAFLHVHHDTILKADLIPYISSAKLKRHQISHDGDHHTWH